METIAIRGLKLDTFWIVDVKWIARTCSVEDYYGGFSIADGTIYATDIVAGRILAINSTTSSVVVLYQARDDSLPYTVAVGQQYVYFSAWNRKLV